MPGPCSLISVLWSWQGGAIYAEATTLLAALQRLVSVESVSDYSCESCHSPSTARKQLSLCKLPPVLIFHAKRFRHGIKVNDLLSFAPDELLDMRPFTTAAVLGQRATAVEGQGRGMYRMVCVVEHIGRTMNGGHYVAYVRHRARWLKCDDTKVSEVCVRAAIHQMLFFPLSAILTIHNESALSHGMHQRTLNGMLRWLKCLGTLWFIDVVNHS